MQDFNFELTKDEMDKIDQAVRNVGTYGSIEIVKNGHTIDIIESKRIRIRNGKNNFHKG